MVGMIAGNLLGSLNERRNQISLRVGTRGADFTGATQRVIGTP